MFLNMHAMIIVFFSKNTVYDNKYEIHIISNVNMTVSVQWHFYWVEKEALFLLF